MAPSRIDGAELRSDWTSETRPAGWGGGQPGPGGAGLLESDPFGEGAEEWSENIAVCDIDDDLDDDEAYFLDDDEDDDDDFGDDYDDDDFDDDDFETESDDDYDDDDL